MRLIDADALKRNILCWKNCYNGYSDAYDKSMIIGTIEEMPTVEADVVRCKDCVYAKPFNKIWQLPIMDTLVCTNFGNEKVDENFFCGCAIKKEVEE